MRRIAARSAAESSCRQALATPAMSRSRLALAIAATLSSSAAMHVAPASAVEAPGDVTLEEVVVTARKRTENLQDVPVSIDVFTSKDLHHLAIRRLREPHSVHFVRERRSRYADVRDARRIRRQQPELRQHRLHRLPARRHVDELLRHHARPSSVRHCANRSAQRSAGDDVRRRRHGRRVAFHHQQARPQGVQRRHRRRRRQGRVRQPQRHGGGVHQHPPHRRLDGAAYFRVQRLPRRIHQQSEHHPQLGERHGVEQFAVVGEELQRGEGDGRPDRPRSSHCGRLESLVDLQLPARTHARRVGPGSDHRRRGRCRRQPGQRPGTLSRFPQRGSLWPGIQAVLHEDLGFPSGGRRGHR